MATLFSDDFNTGTEPNSTNWTESSADWDLVSSRLRCVSNPGAIRFCQTTTSAHAAQTDVKAGVTRITGSGFDGGVAVRTNGANTMYYLNAYGSNNIDVYRRVGGADTLVGSRNQTHAANDIFALEVSGTGATVTLKVYRNGTQVSTNLSDSSGSRITASGQTGVIAWTEPLDYDDFLVEDLAGGATGHPAIKRAGGVPYMASLTQSGARVW